MSTPIRMEHVTLERDGVSQTFAPHASSGHYILDHEGLGSPDPALRLYTGESRDGGVIAGSRTEVRTILLMLGLRGSSRADLQAKRDALQQIVGVGVPVSLTVERPDGASRRITAWRQGGDDMVFRTTNRVGNHERVAIRFVCPVPYFDSGMEVDADITGQASDQGTPVPTPIPMTLGGATWGQVFTVRNDGNVKTYPTIRLTGLLRTARVRNLTTGGDLRFETNYTIPGSVAVEFDAANSTVVLVSTGANLLANINPLSNLSDWHLAPGDNRVQVNTDNTDLRSRALLTFNPLYLSGV